MAGRPPLKPTKAQRYRVSILAAAGMSQLNIARAIGIDEHTLAKHFGEELTTGAAKRNSEVLAVVFKGAKAGQAAQQRLWLTRQGGVAPGSPGESSVGKLGKKEQAEVAATTAHEGTDWVDLVKH